LLSVQRAFLEQRDEILNGVLHTLFLLRVIHDHDHRGRPLASGQAPRPTTAVNSFRTSPPEPYRTPAADTVIALPNASFSGGAEQREGPAPAS